MIYFFINIPLNEVLKLEDVLPKGCYCLFQMQNASTRYYGIIRKDSYQLMLQTLTEDSKKNVEMLDKNIFQMFFLQNISDSIIYLGNRKLMAYISDEY
jgi:hypothetical protein